RNVEDHGIGRRAHAADRRSRRGLAHGEARRDERDGPAEKKRAYRSCAHAEGSLPTRLARTPAYSVLKGRSARGALAAAARTFGGLRRKRNRSMRRSIYSRNGRFEPGVVVTTEEDRHAAVLSAHHHIRGVSGVVDRAVTQGG